MTDEQHQAAAAARAAHYQGATDQPPVNRVEPNGDQAERGAVGDFLYQAATSGVGDLGATALVAGGIAAGKAVVNQVKGEQSQGKHEATE